MDYQSRKTQNQLKTSEHLLKTSERLLKREVEIDQLTGLGNRTVNLTIYSKKQ